MSTNGEILGIQLAFFTAFMIHCILPILNIFILYKNDKFLLQENVKEYIGELYKGIKVQKWW
jgi:hypothetical protein